MLHRGQFAILKKKLEDEHYRTLELSGSWILSYHEKVPVVYNSSEDILLLGHVWQAEPGKPAPSQQVLDCTSPSDLLKEEETWCGRYVLVVADQVYLDASGLFGVFYSEIGISSDLSILTAQMNLSKTDWKPDDIIRWFPGPGTPYEKIFRQLPSQIYDLDSGRLAFRNLLAQGVERIENESLLIEKFSDLFCSSLNNLAEKYADHKLLIALTGGYDSRTLFALAVRAGIPFECYTLEHDRMPLGDIEYPPRLCEIEKIPYAYYHRDQTDYSREREEEYIEHLSGMQLEQDRTFYAFGQYQELTEKFGPVVLLRSGVWEIVQEYDRRAVDEKCDIRELLNYYELPLNSLEASSFQAFFDWCNAHPLPMTDTNRYFWEQRCGSWIAESEHGFDIYEDIISLQPVNCRKLLTMLFQFPKQERMVKYHQVRIINEVSSSLAQIPFGKNEVFSTSKLVNGQKAVSKLFRRLHKIGISRTIALYRHIAKDKQKTKAAIRTNNRRGLEK